MESEVGTTDKREKEKENRLTYLQFNEKLKGATG